MFETLLFALILIFLNLILIFKRVPLLGLFVGGFTLLISLRYFINDTTLPVNTVNAPFFTIFVCGFAGLQLIAQAIEIRK